MQVKRKMPVTQVQDERLSTPPGELPSTPSPRSCIALFQTSSPLLSPLNKSPQPTSANHIQEQEMQESDTPTTTISSMDVTSETNKKCKNPQPLDKEGKNLYDHLHLDPRFFFLQAPSTYRDEHYAEVLSNVRERSIFTGNRAVSFFLSTLDHIRKEQSQFLGPFRQEKTPRTYYIIHRRP